MQFFNHIKSYFGLYLTICFGIFLFILFFEPFPVDTFSSQDRLVFIGGLAGIIFVLILSVKVIFSSWINLPLVISNFSLLVLSSVAFAFYLRYVGKVPITFFIMVKVILVCLVPPVTFWISDILVTLKGHNEALIYQINLLQNQLEKYEAENLNKSIEFISENGRDTFTLPVTDVICLRSADNYVEIIYRESEGIRKKLIRNTLRGIELQIKLYSNFIRSHRQCIVNTHFIESLTKKYSGYVLSISGFNEKLPVSRQYLLKLKEIAHKG